MHLGGHMKDEILDELQNTTEIEFVELDEVSIAGADSSQLTSQEEGRALGFGCLDS